MLSFSQTDILKAFQAKCSQVGNFIQISLKFSLNISSNFLIGNKEGLQELHEAYQILLKIIMGAKNRFKKKSQVYIKGMLKRKSIVISLLGNSSNNQTFKADDSRVWW